jgi:hypothetical protein
VPHPRHLIDETSCISAIAASDSTSMWPASYWQRTITRHICSRHGSAVIQQWMPVPWCYFVVITLKVHVIKDDSTCPPHVGRQFYRFLSRHDLLCFTQWSLLHFNYRVTIALEHRSRTQHNQSINSIFGGVIKYWCLGQYTIVGVRYQFTDTLPYGVMIIEHIEDIIARYQCADVLLWL